LWLFVICYGIAVFFEIMFRMLPADVDMIEQPRGVVVGTAAGIYAMYRMIAFHPVFSPTYHAWLRSTPWTAAMPLPKGPVQLVWQDGIVLGTLLILAFGCTMKTLATTVGLFLCVHLIMVMLVLLLASIPAQLYIIAFGMGALLSLEEHGYTDLCALLLLVLCMVARAGLRRSIESISWTSRSVFELTAAELFSSHAKREARTSRRDNALGYPYQTLKARPLKTTVPLVHAVLLGALAAWYVGVYAISTEHPHIKADTLGWILIVVSTLGALIRWLVYRVGHAPPISIRGRLRARTWYIPGYDRIYVAPLAALAIGFVINMGRIKFGIPLHVATPLGVFAVILVLFAAGPDLAHWRLIGHHHLTETREASASMIRI
jgi:hypothetical protein